MSPLYLHVDEAFGEECMHEWLDNIEAEWVHPFLLRFKAEADLLAFKLKFKL